MQGTSSRDVRVVGRYALHGAIASGGMATVHFGRLLGPVGFSRTVAIKRLHAQFATDPEFVSMFLDEARLAARVRHPNVVATLDVVALNSELFLVMEYVAGESVANLAKMAAKARQPIPHRIVSSIVAGALHGLHAAHEAKDERGMPLGIVHRDVSPQNIHVGTDGVARVLDFGVAKAAGRVQTTREGQLKGKLSYMAPEQLRGQQVTRTCDIYAVGVMLWELITGQRLFDGDNEGVVIARVIEGKITAPSLVLMKSSPVTLNSKMYEAMARLDACVLRALDKDPAKRFQTAREMAIELENAVNPATLSQVGEWVEEVAVTVLSKRLAAVSEIESYSTDPGFERPSDVHRAAIEAGQYSSSAMLHAERPSSSSPSSLDAHPMSSSGATPTPGGTISSLSRTGFQKPQTREKLWIAAAVSLLAVLAGIGLQRCTRTEEGPQATSPETERRATAASAPVLVATSAADAGAPMAAPVDSRALEIDEPPAKPAAAPTASVRVKPRPTVAPPPKNCDYIAVTKPDGTIGYKKPAGCPQ